MNNVAPVSPPRRRHLVWKILGGAMLLWVVAVAMLAVEVFTLTRGAGTLRKEMLAAIDAPVHSQIQLSVGPGTLAAARTVLTFVHDAPAEARDALKAVRMASVGVYGLGHDATPAVRREMFEAADRAMSRRGWTRIVGVNNTNETVVIYAPSSDSDSSTQQVCVAVCEAEKLVIVEGVIDGAQLVTLAARMHPGLALK